MLRMSCDRWPNRNDAGKDPLPASAFLAGMNKDASRKHVIYGTVICTNTLNMFYPTEKPLSFSLNYRFRKQMISYHGHHFT